jgi:sigma-E factor negative regulatory protein RseA
MSSHNTMSGAVMSHDPSHEELSAFMDGELGRVQARFLLRRVDRDTAAMRRWDAYHLAQASMQRNLPLLTSAGFAEGVAARIAAQPLPASSGAPWLRWSARGAIAAAVVVAALVLMPPQSELGTIATDAQLAAAPAPAWLSAQAESRVDAFPAYRMVGARRDTMAMVDPLAATSMDASAFPQDDGVLPYLLSPQEHHRYQPVDAADR